MPRQALCRIGLVCAVLLSHTVAARAGAAVAVPALDVPYLPQTEDLCGGAAAAMVLRYYGEAHATAQQFADLVDRRAGGIATDALVARLRRLGWRASEAAGSIASIRSALAASRPVLVLVEDRPGRYHYLVVVGLGAASAIVHDPEWGPSRPIPIGRLEQAWAAAGFWSVVVEPSAERGAPDLRAAGADPEVPASRLASLAGVRFGEGRWRDASDLAARAAAADPRDSYAWDVLGSARFVQDDGDGALDAWNRIDRPRIDRVKIEGLSHARFAALANALGLSPGALLTADALRRAARRLEEWPDRSATRIGYEPRPDGYAVVDVAIVPRQRLPHTPMQWSAAAVEAAVTGEAAAAVPGAGGEGGLWSAAWRWRAGQPRTALSFAAPHAGLLPGVWRVDASWEAETYAPARSGRLRETRAHAALAMSDWVLPNLRYEVTAGLDRWSGGPVAPFAGGRLERRWLADRLALSGGATVWEPVDGRTFEAVDARASFDSSPGHPGFRYLVRSGAQAASAAAPTMLWSGAGGGFGRRPLLRAHPLLSDGAIAGAIFGRRLVYGTAEAQRWIGGAWPVRFGLAAFADAARATHGFADAAAPLQTDIGGGLRVALPARRGALRVDLAHGLRDGSTAVTFGWQR